MIKLKVIKIEDDRYPEKLRKIKNPPKQLYAEGNIELLKNNIISIIGSRACSENGERLARQFAKELVYQDITIASGMAIGIDAVAHKSTLKENGKTIAVLGNGLNYIFPKQNADLYEEIVKNGLVITEYPPDEKPKSQHFLDRNRIVSGLSLGILVIEAAYRSGTSVTAKMAIQQGKRVFALPHEVGDLHGVGTNRLIAQGAKIVTNSKDIIENFPFLSYKEPPQEESVEMKPIRKKCENIEYNKVYKFITENPISLNEIYKKSNEEISKINNVLLMLEIEGYIEKVVGGYRCILDKK